MKSLKDELDQTIAQIGAIPLRRWCQITGESAGAVHQRVYRKRWIEGVHVTRPAGETGWWVQLAAVREWIAGTTPEALLADVVRAESGLTSSGRNPVPC